MPGPHTPTPSSTYCTTLIRTNASSGEAEFGEDLLAMLIERRRRRAHRALHERHDPGRVRDGHAADVGLLEPRDQAGGFHVRMLEEVDVLVHALVHDARGPETGAPLRRGARAERGVQGLVESR